MRLSKNRQNLENDDVGFVYDITNQFIKKMFLGIYQKFWVCIDYINDKNMLRLLTNNELTCIEKVSFFYNINL